jgi:hypothetical protein
MPAGSGISPSEVALASDEFRTNTFRRALRGDGMTVQPESGELLVGSYLRLVTGCELVTCIDLLLRVNAEESHHRSSGRV